MEIMKRLISKLIAFLIAFTMIATLVPAIPANAGETGSLEEYSVEINEKNFPDSEFRRYLQDWYDQDKDGDDNILTAEELKRFTEFWHTSSDEYRIKDLTGIDLLTNTTRIYIANTRYIKTLPEKLPPLLEEIAVDNSYVTNIPVLPDTLKYLYAQDAALNKLPELPDTLERLWVSENNFTELPKLPESLKSLSCWGNTNLDKLPSLPEGLTSLNCDDCKIASLPKLPESLTELRCHTNQLTELPELPEGLGELLCDYNKLKALPKLPAELTTLEASNNELGGVLDLSYLEYLTVIDLSDNKLTGVKLCPTGSYSEIDVRDNAMSGTDKVTGAEIDWEDADERGYSQYGDFMFYKQTAYCDVYGHSYNLEHISKGSFNYNGYKEYRCSRCGDYKDVRIPALSSAALSAKSYTFNNKVKTPTVTVKDASGNKLPVTVKYASGRKNVGKYAITATLKNNTYYSGSSTSYFVINPKGVSISKLSNGKKAFTVKWSKPSSTYRKQMTGYQIKYSTSSKMTNSKTVTVKSTTATSKTIKKLKAKTNYYVQLRTYKTVNGANYYSSWSKVKKVKTK